MIGNAVVTINLSSATIRKKEFTSIENCYIEGGFMTFYLQEHKVVALLII